MAYGLIAAPFLRKHEKVRQHARQIDAIIPPNIPLYAVNPKYQPYLFYVRAPIRYVSTIEQLPADTKFFLVQGENENRSRDDKTLVAEPAPAGFAHYRLSRARGDYFFCSIPALILVDNGWQRSCLEDRIVSLLTIFRIS